MSLPSGKRIVLPIVPEGTTSNRVDDNKEHEKDDVDGSNLLPVILDVGKKTSLARLAVVAEDALIIRPSGTVWVVGHEACFRFIPHSGILVNKAAL